MTVEMQNILDEQLKSAVESGDQTLIMKAMSAILSALMDCQRKTADRVKELMIERDRAKERVKGARILWDLLKVLVGAGGGAALLKFLGA